MCGIVGIVTATPNSDRSRLDAMRQTMRHRGPDDAGSWWSPDGRVGLAHRRLAIIDLTTAGRQPMLDETCSVALVYNGEIYNFQSLRDELAAGGVRFRSTSDTEVLLQAYRKWGVDCLARLDGMFAFAIYDIPVRRLILARDRAGEKPLFVYLANGQLRFASELKALLADPAVPREIDRQALNHYLAYGYVPGELCMLRGVQKLPAGCVMTYELDSGRASVQPYWRLPSAAPPESADENELVDRLHELLAESVRRRMVADVPVGILLSGGIDSSLVTAMAAEVSPQPVKTFTISFPGHGAYDEGPYARRVAEHFATEHTELVAEPATVELLPELARQYDEPMADSSMVPTYMVCKLIRQYATVALGGDGGDELFGGYPGHSWIQKMQRIRRFMPSALRRPMHALFSRWIKPGKFGRNFILGALAEPAAGIAQINLFFDTLYRPAVTADTLIVGGREALEAPEARKIRIQQDYRTPVQKITGMDFRTYLVDDILVKVDRASMLTSLEVRAPFLATPMIEFAFSAVPDRLRATATEKKILPRKLAGRLLPKDMDLRRKQGFMLPLQQWFRGSWGQYCRQVLLDGAGEVFRREMVERLLAEQHRGYRHTQRLFAMTMFELWRREYNIKPPSD